MLLLARNVGPATHFNGWAIALIVCSFAIAWILHLGGLFYYHQLLRLYRTAHNLPIPVGYAEERVARTSGGQTYSRERSQLFWKRQSDPDFERLRVRARTMILVSYVIWIGAIILVAPRVWLD